MKYTATIGRERFEIEIATREDGVLVVEIDGVTRPLRIDAQSPDTFHVTEETAAWDAHVRRQSGTQERVYLGNHAVAVDLLDERQLRSQRATQAGAEPGHQTIASPMPGKVVNLLKALGDRVKAGEGVIVVEAMKMENELKAAVDGVVVELLVQVGDTVDSDAPLVHIAPPDTGD
ncbi:MAG: hypothetical protein KC609_10230 [Myxococcales bacterium]|nr:hypothetical protein [Myxococcales bacterium]